MTEQNIIDMVTMLPEIRAIPNEIGDKSRSVKAFISTALEETVLAYDWDFACDEATFSGGTTADTAAYRLDGNSKDCRDIINVRYDTDFRLLDKRSETDMDEWLTGRSISGVHIWVPAGREYGFPVITLYDTPDADDEVITYRYRRKDVSVDEFPDEFGFVLVSGVAKRLIPAYTAVYDKDLKFMMDKYAGEGGEDEPAKLDPHVVRLNNRRARLHGYS